MHVCTYMWISLGDPVFKPHALLLRGSLCTLWRMEKEALLDLQEVVNMEGLAKEVREKGIVCDLPAQGPSTSTV